MEDAIFVLDHPLKDLGYEDEEVLNVGGFGAVMARAGVGKTAFLVQIALTEMLRGKRVLHVSLRGPVGKVSLWYDEMFHLLSEQKGIPRKKSLLDEMFMRRFIMTFKVEGFSVPILEERLNDLMAQHIFEPDILVIDGLAFEEGDIRPALEELKGFALKNRLRVWFTVPIHRHVEKDRQGMPTPLMQVEDLFDTALLLYTKEEKIVIRDMKKAESGEKLVLDPSSLLIQKN